MKLNYGSRYSLVLALSLAVTFLAQVNISQGLQCYMCVYAEKDVEGVSSATCEKNPAYAELEDVSRSSRMIPGALPQILKTLSASQGILSTFATAPNASSITVLNPDNSLVVEDGRTAGTDATYLYCVLAKLNHKYLGRVVIRLAATTNKDVGATYCDEKLPSGTGLSASDISNVNNCYCRSSACNGKDISGAEKAGQSMGLLIFSIGLAMLCVIWNSLL